MAPHDVDDASNMRSHPKLMRKKRLTMMMMM